MEVLLDSDAVARGLARVAGQILERHRGTSELVLVGIRRGGVPVAEQLRACLERLEPGPVPVGTIDITLYRDDSYSTLPNPKIGPSDIPTPLAKKSVILVDDVISTGRTTRAAIDAVLDYGRPRRIELAVVVDRGHRELPLQPDYCVRSQSIPRGTRVDVVERGGELVAVLLPSGAPSMLPPADLEKLFGGES